MVDAAGMSGDDWLKQSYPGLYLNNPTTSDLDFNLALAPLLMDLLKKFAQLPDFTLGEPRHLLAAARTLAAHAVQAVCVSA